jgi:hypothetical protein
MQEAEGDVRTYWRKAINYALTERAEIAGLVGVDLANGEVAYVERAVYDAMLEHANERMSYALDLHEEALNAALLADTQLNAALDHREAVEIRSEVEPDNGDEPDETATPERETPAARLPAVETPTQIARMIREGLQAAAAEVASDFRAEIRKARGRVE